MSHFRPVKSVNHFVLLMFLTSGFIYFFIGPQVYKFDCTQKHVVAVEKANSWLGC